MGDGFFLPGNGILIAFPFRFAKFFVAQSLTPLSSARAMAMASDEAATFGYDRPLKIGRDVHWVGSYCPHSRNAFNSFIVQDGEEAVLMDAGFREGLPSLVLKVLQLGIQPGSIKALIQHSLCSQARETRGHLQKLIRRSDLRIVSPSAAFRACSFHGEKGRLNVMERRDFTFSSGRQLEFFRIPFAPGADSFVTFDSHSGVLFTGGLLGSHRVPQLFWGNLEAECRPCAEKGSGRGCSWAGCPLLDMEQHHREIISSEKALRIALKRLARIPFHIVAPQWGSIISQSGNLAFLWKRLLGLRGVGIDGVAEDAGGQEEKNHEELEFVHKRFQANGGGKGSPCPSPESCFAEWDA